jgi:purine-binding chemotaxis protein CheW
MIEEVLIIKEQGCYYGINTEEVEQILRVQDLTPMAMTPAAIRGLCSIEGSIFCTLDFSYLLDKTRGFVDTQSFKARQVTIEASTYHFSLLVSEVINSIEVDQSKVEYVNDADDAIIALLKHKDEIIQVISIASLIKDIALPSYTTKDVRDISVDTSSDAKASHHQRYLFFTMAKERYALEVDAIREIIAPPESFTTIAESNKEILGMMSLREDLLVVADLRSYYDLDARLDEKSRIIVSQHLGRHIGLVVDEIVDIQDVDIDHIEGMPENFKDKKISGVLHLDDALISVVNTEVIRSLVNEQSHLISDHEKEAEAKQGSEEDKLEVVIFKMADEEYAFNIDDVSEIIDMTNITPVADSVKHIKGVINIRGQVISIASLYGILDFEENTDLDQKIIVTNVQGNSIGFVVDKVNDVRGIADLKIKKEEDDNRLFSNVLQLEEGKRLVMMFDTSVLLSSLHLDEETA